MRARADVGSSVAVPAATGVPRRATDLRSLMASSLAVRSAALEVRARDRDQMERSRAILARARACLSRLEAARPTSSSAPVARDAGSAGPARSRGERGCMYGCSRPAPFQPCFVVGYCDRRVLVRALPLRVCAEHRAALDALFRRCSILEALREKLRGRGRDAPEAVQILFEVAQG